MKQETIGSKGTVPGFRPLIGAERWHKENFSTDSVAGGYRPLLLLEDITWNENGDEYASEWEGPVACKFDWQRSYASACKYADGEGYWRTKRPLPPPAVETFEAHGHIWYKHTPGDECPVKPDVEVDVLWETQMKHCVHFPYVSSAGISQNWRKRDDGESIIGYRFPDYPAVHTTLQQEKLPVLFGLKPREHVEKTEQSFQQPPTATIPTQFSTEQRLTSLYNDWCFLPPETVAECIADVASVLYPTDAKRCEAAFQRWKLEEYGESSVLGWAAKIAWTAAWKAAKESKV